MVGGDTPQGLGSDMKPQMGQKELLVNGFVIIIHKTALVPREQCI